MARCLIYILISLIFFSCIKKETNSEFSYFYSEELKIDKMTDKSTAYKAILGNDSLLLYSASRGLMKKVKYKIKVDGIYVIKDKELLLLYPFDRGVEIKRPKKLTSFFYPKVTLVEKKNYYTEGGKKNTIYHFVEGGFDETLDSYYMEGEGFICFYKYSENRFLYLNSPNALRVSTLFLNDSTFFAMLKLREIDKKMWREFNKN